MTTLPTESVLNWSTTKPTFEEVKGKMLIARKKHPIVDRFIYPTYHMDNFAKFETAFNHNFIEYAIISEPLVAKELWGHKPEFRKGIDLCNPLHWIAWGEKTNDTWFIETPAYKSEAEAITAWNQLVDRIEGERC